MKMKKNLQRMTRWKDRKEEAKEKVRKHDVLHAEERIMHRTALKERAKEKMQKEASRKEKEKMDGSRSANGTTGTQDHLQINGAVGIPSTKEKEKAKEVGKSAI